MDRHKRLVGVAAAAGELNRTRSRPVSAGRLYVYRGGIERDARLRVTPRTVDGIIAHTGLQGGALMGQGASPCRR